MGGVEDQEIEKYLDRRDGSSSYHITVEINVVWNL